MVQRQVVVGGDLQRLVQNITVTIEVEVRVVSGVAEGLGIRDGVQMVGEGVKVIEGVGCS